MKRIKIKIVDESEWFHYTFTDETLERKKANRVSTDDLALLKEAFMWKNTMTDEGVLINSDYIKYMKVEPEMEKFELQVTPGVKIYESNNDQQGSEMPGSSKEV